MGRHQTLKESRLEDDVLMHVCVESMLTAKRTFPSPFMAISRGGGEGGEGT